MQVGIDGVVLSCYSDNGDAKEMLSAVVEGKDIEIGFNPRYVIEALRAIEDDEIVVVPKDEFLYYLEHGCMLF